MGRFHAVKATGVCWCVELYCTHNTVCAEALEAAHSHPMEHLLVWLTRSYAGLSEARLVVFIPGRLVIEHSTFYFRLVLRWRYWVGPGRC